MKSDKLKKLELEVKDLKQWLKLGLVPKKDLPKHESEIKNLDTKIADEKERLRFLKESGDLEDYTPARKPARASSYTDSQTLPDIDNSEESSTSGLTDAGLESTQTEFETTTAEKEEETVVEEDEDPFSSANRWRRGIPDPEAADDNW